MNKVTSKNDCQGLDNVGDVFIGVIGESLLKRFWWIFHSLTKDDLDIVQLLFVLCGHKSQTLAELN